MRLFEKMMVDCTKIDRTTSEDGLGGYKSKWKDGLRFKAAVVKNNTLEAKIAEKNGVTEIYTVTASKGTELGYHDVFRRDSDGAIFRITSNARDSETPDMASFQFTQVTAERWELK